MRPYSNCTNLFSVRKVAHYSQSGWEWYQSVLQSRPFPAIANFCKAAMLSAARVKVVNM